MKQLKIIKALEKTIKKSYAKDQSGHDINHLKNVYKNAKKIQKKEGGDLYVICVSAMVHDIHRLMSNRIGHYISPNESLDETRKLLLDCNVDKSKLDAILEAVAHHENKSNKNVSKETLILQDSDTLEAIGKTGLKRTIKYCKYHNIPILSNIPLDSSEYIPDINPISCCHYIYRTMIPNANNLSTQSARLLSRHKVNVLRKFLNKHKLKI